MNIFCASLVRTTRVVVAVAAAIAYAFAAEIASVASAGTEVITDSPPPALRAERPPAHRDGYVWAPGHWEWSGHAYSWSAGTWIPERRGAHWVADEWQANGTHWRYVAGHWER
jgi:WXXGXW repeat (2 copies)